MRTSLMRRWPAPLWLAVGLIVGFVATSVDLASGTHIRPVRKNSTAAFAPGFVPPDAFRCEWVNRRDGQLIHDYECKDPDAAPGTSSPFRLQDVLVRGGNPPGGKGWEGLATPDRFSCERDGGGGQDAAHYRCSYQHREQGRLQTHTFRADEIVSVSDHEEDGEAEDIWYPPHRHGAC